VLAHDHDEVVAARAQEALLSISPDVFVTSHQTARSSPRALHLRCQEPRRQGPASVKRSSKTRTALPACSSPSSSHLSTVGIQSLLEDLAALAIPLPLPRRSNIFFRHYDQKIFSTNCTAAAIDEAALAKQLRKQPDIPAADSSSANRKNDRVQRVNLPSRWLRGRRTLIRDSDPRAAIEFRRWKDAGRRDEQAGRAVLVLDERFTDAGLVGEVLGSVSEERGESFGPFDGLYKDVGRDGEQSFLRFAPRRTSS